MNNLFHKYAHLITWFANTTIGREYLSYKTLPLPEHVHLLVPNGYHVITNYHKRKVQATFTIDAVYGAKLLPALLAIDTLSHSFASFREAQEKLILYLFTPHRIPVYHTVTSFTPNTGAGEIDTGNIGTWASCRAASTGTAAATHRTYASTGFDIIRTFFPFNTSSIGGGSTISAGVNTFKVFRDDTVLGLFNGDTTRFELIQTSQASATSLANSDFPNVTFTSGGTFTLASTSNNTYSTITLNVTADGWISKTGNTLLGGVLGRDFDNSQPTGTNGIGHQNRAAANPPTLAVTYTPAPASGFLSFF